MSALHTGKPARAAGPAVAERPQPHAPVAGEVADRAAPPVAAAGRLYSLDWIRVVVIGGVFVCHTMLVFSGLPWLISSDQHIFWFTAPFLAIGQQVAMPLLFLVSGAATGFSLRKRTGRQFVRERFYRLVIPYVVFVILLSPIQAYYEALDHGAYQGGFLAYLPQFFNLDHFGNFDLTWAGAYGYHLWFLIFLFFYSVISLPLFLYLRRGRARWLPALLVRVCRWPAGILLLAAPIAISQVILRPYFGDYQSWADTFFWGFFYVYGYLFFASTDVGATLDRHWRASWVGFAGSGVAILVLGLVTALGIERIYSFAELHGTRPAALISAVALTLISLNSWAGVLFFMNLFKRVANQGSPALQYLGEIAMPFYLIHHPVIVVFGYYIVRLPVGVWTQLLLLFASAAAITLGIIELFIRRIGFLRGMVGMKPEPAGITFNLRRSAPWQAGFAAAVIAYGWLLSALGA